MVTRIFKASLALLLALPLAGWGTTVEYEIAFSPPFTNQFVGSRNLEGRLSIDAASIGPSFAGLSFGPRNPALAGIQSFTVTLNGSLVYQYNDLYSSQILEPGFSEASDHHYFQAARGQ